MYTKTEREEDNILRQLLPPDKQVTISSFFKCTIRDCGKANAAAATSASQKSSAAAGSDCGHELPLALFWSNQLLFVFECAKCEHDRM